MEGRQTGACSQARTHCGPREETEGRCHGDLPTFPGRAQALPFGRLGSMFLPPRLSAPDNQRLLDVSAHLWQHHPPASRCLLPGEPRGRHQQIQGCTRDPGSVQPVTASNSQRVVKVKRQASSFSNKIHV